MAKLFGFSIEDGEKNPKGVVSPIPPQGENGVDFIIFRGIF